MWDSTGASRESSWGSVHATWSMSAPDVNEAGNPTFQRWKIEPSPALKITVDFVIPPSLDENRGGNLRHIEKDFTAVIRPGLQLAFKDRQKIVLQGSTLLCEKARREIWVCWVPVFWSRRSIAGGCCRFCPRTAYEMWYCLIYFHDSHCLPGGHVCRTVQPESQPARCGTGKGTIENDREAGYTRYHGGTFGRIRSGVIKRAVGR